MSSKELHSSIQIDPSLVKYTGDSCKYYYLPLHENSKFSEKISEIFGASNKTERSWIDIKSSVLKAKNSHCSHVKFPLDRADDLLLSQAIDEVVKEDMGIVLQVPTSSLSDSEYLNYIKSFHKNFEIEFILDGAWLQGQVEGLAEYFDSYHFTIPVYRDINFLDVITKEIFSCKRTIHLYFPYQMNVSDSHLSCSESHRVLGLMKKAFPSIEFLPPKGVDIWDRRVMSDFDMDPFILPCFEMKSEEPCIKYSVIIPTYNNQNHLRVTLRHLFRQNIGLNQFEIIVVDDGGTDQTQELVMKLLEESGLKINFKYIFFPRPRKRVMGDSQYRAGISRNLGVKNAVGDILCFLDSDIVTPENYLQDVGEQLKTWDALQAKRVNLTENASTLDCEYEMVKQDVDLTSDEAYWEAFIAQTTSWHELPYNWKYVCTHSFSLKRELFWKIGGLKKNFIFYGFEDTDLGYRLAKRGYKLHLLDVKVYHLFHENARSEFMNLKSLRHNLLSKTAQIFYLHHLDEDIYKNLLGFMEPEPSLKRLLSRIWKLMTLQFLWKPKPPVFKTLRSWHRKNINEMA